jgi:predicted nucleotidyltransferase
MRLNDDIRDLWAEFERSEVEFVLVGGWAVTLHARPRTTKDVDLVLRGTPLNLSRAAEALARFGAPTNVVKAVENQRPDEVVYFGQPPLRVDLLRTIDGVTEDELFAGAVTMTLDGAHVRVISLEHLIRNKRATGRPQDVLDAELLAAMRPL